jgi:hypothetical protein
VFFVFVSAIAALAPASSEARRHYNEWHTRLAGSVRCMLGSTGIL